MKKLVPMILFAFVVLVQLSAAAAKDGDGKGAHYSGVLIGTGGAVGGASMWMDMYVDEFTSDEEALRFVKTLKEKGQDAVVRELEKSDVGRLTASRGGIVRLSVARRFESETGTVVRLFTARPLLFLEQFAGTRSTNYPISLIELMLDKDGNGQGAVVGAARVKITEDGRLELESLGNQYVKITNVRRVE